MNRFLLFLSALLPFLFLLESSSCSPKQGVEEVGKGTTLLDLFYGMTGGEDGDNSYRGTSCILDSLPGVIRYEDFGEWREPEEQRWYESSLILYVDSTIPSEAIARSLFVYADSILDDYFFRDRFPHPDLTEVRSGSDIVEFFRRSFEGADSVMAFKKKPVERFYPFRVAVVLCRIFSWKGLSTYILENSVDANGSSGCPSEATYVTNDMNGEILVYGDIFKNGSKSRVNKLLNKRYDEEYEKKNDQKREPHEPYDLVGDNCALVKEGVIFYYPPYTLGPGAEGQYNLILEYDEIENLLKENISHGSE